MINKKIASEIAIGVIVLVAVAMGASVWVQNKNSVTSNQEPVNSDQKQLSVQESVTLPQDKQVPIAESKKPEVKIVKRDGKNFVILIKDGKEIIVDQGVAEYDKGYENMADVKNFSDTSLSITERFLLYKSSGFEWQQVNVYDITKQKVVFKQDSAENVQFVKDDKYLLSCGASKFAGTFDGYVFDTQNLEKSIFSISEYDKKASESYSSVICTVNDDTVSMYLNNDDWEGVGKDEKPANRTIQYSLSQKAVIK